jgi:hypothetical protein
MWNTVPTKLSIGPAVPGDPGRPMPRSGWEDPIGGVESAAPPVVDRANRVRKDGAVGRKRRTWQPEPEDGAFISQRAHVHLVYRLAGRAIQAVLAGESDDRTRRITDAALWAGADVAGALALRRSSRFGLVPRLALDVVDITHWGGRGEDADLAVISGLPLSVEAGIRMGPAALVIPVVSALVTGAVRRHRKLPVSAFSFRWQVIGVGAGIGLAAYGRNRREVLLSRRAQDLEAQLQEAYIGGQNDVAMGADSVVDLLSRTTPLLPEGSDHRVVGRLLAMWKQSLAADSQARSSYLGVALAQWQRRHNSTHAALDADVCLDVDPGAGTMLLTGGQAAWLEGALDELGLRGRARVTVVDGATPPTTPRRILIGEDVVLIPADRITGLSPIDVGPLGFVVGAIWCLDTMSSANARTSPWAVGPVVAGGLGLAAWSNRQIDRDGARAHRRVVASAFGMAAAHAVAGTVTMSSTRARNGMQRFPFLSGVDMLGLMLPLYLDEFGWTEQVGMALGLIGLIGLGLLLMPEPIIWTHLVCELLWSGAAALSITGLATGLSHDAGRLHRQLSEEEDAAVNRSFVEGRAFVVSMVAEAGVGARRAFHEVSDQLAPVVADEIGRRLDEVWGRLRALGYEGGAEETEDPTTVG